MALNRVQEEIRNAARALEEAEELLHPHNPSVARDIRTLEIEILRYLIDGDEDGERGFVYE